MQRFYKIGTCDWCNRHRVEVFLTTFESSTNKLMCNRCKDFIEHKRKVSDGVDHCVDEWDTYKSDNSTLSEPALKAFGRRSNKFVIKQSDDKNVTLYGFKDNKKFVVEYFKEKTLNPNKLFVWDYTSLGPASRRFNLCLEENNGRFQGN